MTNLSSKLTINLLPDRDRRAVMSKVEDFHRTPLMAIVFGTLVLTPIVLTVMLMMGQRTAARLQRRIAELEPKRAEMEQIQQSLQRLKGQEETLRGTLLQTGDLWSARLNALSNHTPDGVWFRELQFDTGKGLVLQGAALSQDKVGMASVTQLVQGLKTDPDFASAFKELRIESIKSVQDGPVEVVQFTLAGVQSPAAKSP